MCTYVSIYKKEIMYFKIEKFKNKSHKKCVFSNRISNNSHRQNCYSYLHVYYDVHDYSLWLWHWFWSDTVSVSLLDTRSDFERLEFRNKFFHSHRKLKYTKFSLMIGGYLVITNEKLVYFLKFSWKNSIGLKILDICLSREQVIRIRKNLE